MFKNGDDPTRIFAFLGGSVSSWFKFPLLFSFGCSDRLDFGRENDSPKNRGPNIVITIKDP
jgi:hypothetical protein